MITFAFTIVFLFVLCARFVYLVMVYFILFFFWHICFFVCVVIQQIPWNGKHFFTSLHRLSLLRKRVSSSSLYEMNWRNSYVPSFRGGGGWGGSTNGPIFNLVMKIIRDCIRSVTGPENAHYSLNQSDASLKSITTWFFVCSRTRGITVGLLLFFNVYVGFDRTESLKAVMNRQQ